MATYSQTHSLAELAKEYNIDYSRAIGRGGFGCVFVAADSYSKRPVAIKLIGKENLKLWIEVNGLKSPSKTLFGVIGSAARTSDARTSRERSGRCRNALPTHGKRRRSRYHNGTSERSGFV
jgi:serine/threonine protein kinase